jgi:hypothetical protein
MAGALPLPKTATNGVGSLRSRVSIQQKTLISKQNYFESITAKL